MTVESALHHDDDKLSPSEELKLLLSTVPPEVQAKIIAASAPSVAADLTSFVNGQEVTLTSYHCQEVEWKKKLFIATSQEGPILEEGEEDVLMAPSPASIPFLQTISKQHPALVPLGSFIADRYKTGFSYENTPAGVTSYSPDAEWGWEIEPEVFRTIIGFSPEDFVLPEGYTQKDFIAVLLAVEHSQFIDSPPIVLSHPYSERYTRYSSASPFVLQAGEPTEKLRQYLTQFKLPEQAFTRNFAAWKTKGELFAEVNDLSQWDAHVRIKKRLMMYITARERQRGYDRSLLTAPSLGNIVGSLEETLLNDIRQDLFTTARQKRRTPRQVAEMIFDPTYSHVPAYDSDSVHLLESIDAAAKELGVRSKFSEANEQNPFNWAVKEALQENADTVIRDPRYIHGSPLRGYFFWSRLPSRSAVVKEYAKALSEIDIMGANLAIQSAQRLGLYLSDKPIGAMYFHPDEVLEDIYLTTGHHYDRTALEAGYDILSTHFGLASSVGKRYLARTPQRRVSGSFDGLVITNSEWLHLPTVAASSEQKYAMQTVDAIEQLAESVAVKRDAYTPFGLVNREAFDAVSSAFRFKPLPIRRFYQALGKLSQEDAVWTMVCYRFANLTGFGSVTEWSGLSEEAAQARAKRALRSFRDEAASIWNPDISPDDAGEIIAELTGIMEDTFPALRAS